MHVGQLVNMLRAPGVSALPGTVAIVAVKAAGSIAQQRPFFINKILPVLVALASAQVSADACCSWAEQYEQHLMCRCELRSAKLCFMF